MTIEWKNKLMDFYDVAEFALREKESKKILAFLRENHINNLKIIRDIHLEKFGKNERIKSLVKTPDSMRLHKLYY